MRMIRKGEPDFACDKRKRLRGDHTQYKDGLPEPAMKQSDITRAENPAS
jgi:hypothetical protein